MPRREDTICPHGWQRSACARCRSKRNKRFGQAVQREMHQALGGTGWTPTHEETGRGYEVEYVGAVLTIRPDGDGFDLSIDGKPVVPVPGEEMFIEGLPAEIKVHPEAKGGDQIPASLVKFLGTEWYRRALSQSERSLPIGSQAKPAVWCHMTGGRKVLIVDYGGGHGSTKV